ncbi:MAG: OmpA family protein [Sulfurovum sp.]|nr:OmpA family protein [Sulfurovum sp.]
MTHKLWILATVSVWIFSGCAQSAPDLDIGGNVNSPDAITGDTITIDEMSYGNENGSEGYNSSSDGFASIYFGFDQYAVASAMVQNMATNTQVANTASGMIKIEGNCDEFGTDEYNYALGLKRAKSVKDNLIAQGIPASKVTLVSFGESSPVCQTPNDSCYDRNRRVDLRIVR